jgi:hypothetical protein
MKLTKETFDRIKLMLESPDYENTIVGLSAVEASDFKDNLIYVLLLAKQANIKNENMWYKHAPNIHGNFKQLGINLDNPITYEQILSIAKQYKVSMDDIQFIMDKYADELKIKINNALGLNDNAITKLTIKINEYNDENGAVSNDLQRSNADRSILRNVSSNVEQKVE